MRVGGREGKGDRKRRKGAHAWPGGIDGPVLGYAGSCGLARLGLSVVLRVQQTGPTQQRRGLVFQCVSDL